MGGQGAGRVQARVAAERDEPDRIGVASVASAERVRPARRELRLRLRSRSGIGVLMCLPLIAVFGTYAFELGIATGDVPLGAAVSLFMFPILAVSAFFILRGIRRSTA